MRAVNKQIVQYLSDQLGWSPARINETLDARFNGESVMSPELIGAMAVHLAGIAPVNSPAEDIVYYQHTLSGGARSMNARAGQWLTELGSLLRQGGKDARVVVWAHNTHVGDARGISGNTAASIGQLARQRYGKDNVVLIGQAGGNGNVIATHQRGAAMSIIQVPAPRPGSLEALLNDASRDNQRALFVFPTGRDAGWPPNSYDHHAIGVVYDRNNEIYVPTIPGRRYDAIIWHRETTPIRPLHFDEARKDALETLRLPEIL